MFEVLDSYIEIEESNSQEAKWLKDLASTILRLFDGLYEDDEAVYENIVKFRRQEYAAVRDRVDKIKKGDLEAADLNSIGSHNTASGEEEDNDSDFEDADSLEDIKEEESKSDGEEEVKPINKKKKKTNQGFTGLQIEASSPVPPPQAEQGAQQAQPPADDMMANILSGISTAQPNANKGKDKKNNKK